MPPQPSKSQLKIDQQALNKFLLDELAPKLQQGCDAGAEFVSEITPVLYGRLFRTPRSIEPVIEGKRIRSGIKMGGMSLPGLYGEQGIERDVNYGLFVEIRNPFLRPALPDIGDRIVDGLRRKD